MAIVPEYGIKAVDDAFIFKHGVKEIAQQRGMLANFMTVPRFKYLGSSIHFNHSLWTTDMERSVFFDSARENNLSDVAGWWLGGLCKHGRAMTALCSPTTNNYRQNSVDMIPRNSNWGMDNRDVAFRVKNFSANGCLVENRNSAASNPYLVLAATVAAGLDGIVNKLKCPKEMDPEAPALPKTLPEALDALQQDEIITDALGPDLVRWFVEMKRQVDLKIMSSFDPTSDDEKALMRERELYSIYV